jgi:hypothetical protein
VLFVLTGNLLNGNRSFAGQAPIFILAIILVSLKLPASSSADQPRARGQPSKLRRIDFIGSLLLAPTIVGFLGALSLGGQSLPWSHPAVVGLFIGSLILGGLFVLWEQRGAFEPVFPPSLLVQRDVATPYAMIALMSGAQVSMMFSIPLYFRITAHASSTVAGAQLFPAVLGNTVGGLLAGIVIRRTGKYKKISMLAALSSTVSFTLLILRWRGPITFAESLEVIPSGFGMGITGSSMFVALTSSVSPAEVAMTAGGMYLSSSIGMLFGLAVSSSVQLASLRILLDKRLAGFQGRGEIIELVTSKVSAIWKLEKPVQDIVIESYVKSLEYSHGKSFWLQKKVCR